MKKKKAIQEWPLRVCYSMHECYICVQIIRLGERYYDGGYGKRAHEGCTQKIVKSLKAASKVAKGIRRYTEQGGSADDILPK